MTTRNKRCADRHLQHGVVVPTKRTRPPRNKRCADRHLQRAAVFERSVFVFFSKQTVCRPTPATVQRGLPRVRPLPRNKRCADRYLQQVDDRGAPHPGRALETNGVQTDICNAASARRRSGRSRSRNKRCADRHLQPRAMGPNVLGDRISKQTVCRPTPATRERCRAALRELGLETNGVQTDTCNARRVAAGLTRVVASKQTVCRPTPATR